MGKFGKPLGSDPVHLAGGGYAKLAEGIVKQVEEDAVDFNGGKRGREDEQEGEEMGPIIPERKAWIYGTGPGRFQRRNVRGGGSGSGSGGYPGKGGYYSKR
jgi:hypothetical protein